MAKYTKDDFHEALLQTAAELIDEALSKGDSEAALSITVAGALFGARLTRNLFDKDTEIEIITDKE